MKTGVKIEDVKLQDKSDMELEEERKISAPAEFTRLIHVEFDASTGQYTGLPVAWQEQLNKCNDNNEYEGISRVNDNEVVESKKEESGGKAGFKDVRKKLGRLLSRRKDSRESKSGELVIGLPYNFEKHHHVERDEKSPTGLKGLPPGWEESVLEMGITFEQLQENPSAVEQGFKVLKQGIKRDQPSSEMLEVRLMWS